MGKTISDPAKIAAALATAKRKRGRQPLYTDELGDEILTRMRCGHTLAAIAKDLGMPADTLRTWGWREKSSTPAFVAAYAQARLAQAQAWGDQIVELSDEAELKDGRMADVERLKLRIDARKWVAAKLFPRDYGDKQQHEHGGKLEIEIKPFGDKDGKAQ